MAAEHVTAALEAYVGNPTAKLLLVAIAVLADDAGRVYATRFALLGRQVELSHTGVTRYLDELHREHLISRFGDRVMLTLPAVRQ